MESMSEFEARLKRTQSRTRVRSRRVSVPSNDAADTVPRLSGSRWSVTVIAMLVGCVFVASAIAFAREDIARALSGTDEARRASSLES